MGWNDVIPTFAHPVIARGEAYYLHGYHFADAVDVAATSEHGGSFAAAVAKDNIVGVQFHPEKSQAYGLATLERFLSWRPRSEEHTSELQSLMRISYAVFCLKKKKTI